MAFIKRHVVLLSCAAVAFLSLVAIAVGMVMGDVSAQMQEVGRVSTELANLGSPVNDKFLREAEARTRAITAEYGRIWQVVRAMNERKPLRENVFPAPKTPSDAYGFRTDYRAAVDALIPEVLKGKSPPTQEDVRNMEEQMNRERREAVRRGEAAPAPQGPGGFDRVPGVPGGALTGTGGRNIPPEELAKNNAEVRASLARARETLCYAVPEALDIQQDLLNSKEVPSPELMWDAQMKLWIQQDVLGALGKLNEATAAKLDPDKRWVGYMPVKEVVGIRVGDYVLGAGAAAVGAVENRWAEPASDTASITAPPGDASAVFTGRSSNNSNNLYDVIQFAVELVIDSRELPAVVDAICGVNFYTPLSISFTAPQGVNNLVGRIYGSGPLMRVRIEFEGCFFRELFHGTPQKPGPMPKKIIDQNVQGQRLQREGMPGVPSPGGRPAELGPMGRPRPDDPRGMDRLER